MRKLLLLIAVCLVLPLSAQDSFIFEKTAEINKTQSQLYSDTKRFIADHWKSSKAVIENDDKDGGVIQLKGNEIYKYNVGMGLSCEYIYDYTVRFRQKNNKYRIEIYDIVCTKANQVGLGNSREVPLIQPFVGEPEKTQSAGKGLNKKKAKEMMDELRSKMNLIISEYAKFISMEDDF